MLRRDADFTIDRFPGRTVADGSTRRLYRDASQCSLLCIHNQFAPLPGAGRRLSGQGTSGGSPSLGFRRANPLTHYSLPAALRNTMRNPPRWRPRRGQECSDCPYLTAPALAAGHLPSARPQAAMSHNRQIQAPPSFAATTLAIIRLNKSRRVSCSADDRSATSGRTTAARAAATRTATRRPRAVRTTDRVRPSGPAERVTKPSASRRSTSRTAPDGVRPNTECRRSSDGRSRKWASADSAVAPETDCPAAWPAAAVIWSATTRASAPKTLA